MAENDDTPNRGEPEAEDYFLGQLNRHWYRRCLDNLDAELRLVGDYPSVEELRDLCDRIVTGFLKAVAGHSPDADRVQFPADRAYYFPFQGDAASRFNFAKAFYQFPRIGSTASTGGRQIAHGDELAKLARTLWTFFPWPPSKDVGIRIQKEPWVEKNGQVVTLDDVLSVQNLFRDEGAAAHPTSAERNGAASEVAPRLAGEPTDNAAPQSRIIAIQKALLLASPDDVLLEPVLRPKDAAASEALGEAIDETLVASFELYRLLPGNIAVEHWLLNHLSIAHWLHAQATDMKADRRKTGDTLDQTDAGFIELFRRLVKAYFWTNDDDFRDKLAEWLWIAKTDLVFDEAMRAEWMNKTRVSTANKVSTFEALVGTKATKAAPVAPAATPPSAASASAKEKLEAEPRTPPKESEKATADAKSTLRPEAEKKLLEIQPLFVNFRTYMLERAAESRLEDALAGSLGDNLLRSGTTKGSFVWVCRDFPVVEDNFPNTSKFDPVRSEAPLEVAAAAAEDPAVELKRPLTDKDRDLRTARVADKFREIVQAHSDKIVAAYKAFFRGLDIELIRQRDKELRNYWRTVGKTAQERLVWGSWNNDKARDVGIYWAEKSEPVKHFTSNPRPQNLFMRVCVRDSTNEPFINGLFAFSTDYDERASRLKESEGKKTERTRNIEDVEDLLTFSKVYFFTFRDFLRGLDQARDARDIGALNQILYDKRLAELDRLMEFRRKDIEERGGKEGGTSTDGVISRRYWPEVVYDALTAYAFSLLEKPTTVRIETFPFDRVVIFPLAPAVPHAWADLPFFLFQTIYVERDDGKVRPTHYSFVKPYRSPVEFFADARDVARTDLKRTVETGSSARFTQRSFQQESETKGARQARPRFLEKHYLGAEDLGKSRRVLVPRAFPAAGSSANPDWGKTWAQRCTRTILDGASGRACRLGYPLGAVPPSPDRTVPRFQEECLGTGRPGRRAAILGANRVPHHDHAIRTRRGGEIGTDSAGAASRHRQRGEGERQGDGLCPDVARSLRRR